MLFFDSASIKKDETAIKEKNEGDTGAAERFKEV
jgi:hypothetical protein